MTDQSFYRVGNKQRGRQVQVAIVGETVEISWGGAIVPNSTSLPVASIRPVLSMVVPWTETVHRALVCGLAGYALSRFGLQSGVCQSHSIFLRMLFPALKPKRGVEV